MANKKEDKIITINQRLSSIEDQLEEVILKIKEMKDDLRPIITIRMVWNGLPSFLRNIIKLYLIYMVIYDLNDFVLKALNKLHLEKLF